MWHVLYYETAAGRCPVMEFIESRSERNQAKILALISLLQEKGPNLPRPYADLLEDGIHELRCKLSGEQIRILYFFCFGDFIVLTIAFKKTSARVPRADLNVAQKHREDFFKRVDEKKLQELLT